MNTTHHLPALIGASIGLLLGLWACWHAGRAWGKRGRK